GGEEEGGGGGGGGGGCVGGEGGGRRLRPRRSRARLRGVLSRRFRSHAGSERGDAPRCRARPHARAPRRRSPWRSHHHRTGVRRRWNAARLPRVAVGSARASYLFSLTSSSRPD